jgi:hypothetical protein
MRAYQETKQVQSEHIGVVDALTGLGWTAIPHSIMAVYEHHRMMVREQRSRFLFLAERRPGLTPQATREIM